MQLPGGGGEKKEDCGEGTRWIINEDENNGAKGVTNPHQSRVKIWQVLLEEIFFFRIEEKWKRIAFHV